MSTETQPPRRLAAYNPTLRRHAWKHPEQHRYDCLFCGLTRWNREGGAGAWRQEWRWPDGQEGSTLTHPKVPPCPGPTVLHLSEYHHDGHGVVLGDALRAACDRVDALAGRGGQAAARDVVAVSTLRRALARAGEAGGAVVLDAADMPAFARVLTEAARHWAARPDGANVAYLALARTVVGRLRTTTHAWPAARPGTGG